MTVAKLLIVDDYPIVSIGVQMVIEQKTRLKVLSTVQDSFNAINATRENKPDIIILDLNLGANDGIELIKRLKKTSPSSKILVFSSSDEMTYGSRSLKAGASGYLMKNQDLDEVVRAIGIIQSGQKYMSPALTEYVLEQNVFQDTSTDETDNIHQLSDRELQVFKYIGLGLATSKIANKLNLSAKTINSHKENIKRKLQIDSGSDLLMQAISLVEENKI